MQPPRIVGLDGTEPVSRDLRPDDVIVGQAGVEATRDAVDALPAQLRDPLLLSMAGKSEHVIGDELEISAATVHRRIAVARRVLRRELDIGGQDAEIRRRDYGTRRVPNHSPTETQVAPDAASVSTWETIRSLPSRPAPSIGPASSGLAPDIGR
jgi:hypothetical protein